MKTMKKKGNFGVDVSVGLMFAAGNTLAAIENASTTHEKYGALISLCTLVKANPDFIEITDKKNVEELRKIGQKAFELGKAEMNTVIKEQKQ